MDIAKLPDWRVAKAAEIAADATMPDGTRAKKGDVIVLVTHTEGRPEGRLTFATPGAAALAINTAVREALVATEIRKAVPWKKVPKQREQFLTGTGIDVLFNYFEHAMVAAVFSYQALEAFANQIIANVDDLKFPYERRGAITELTGEELEREVSTEEKLATVLPELTGMASPKGKSVWSKFKVLKSVRDSTTHLKSYDHYRRVPLDKESLYYKLLRNSPKDFPHTAITLMRYFSSKVGAAWLVC